MPVPSPLSQSAVLAVVLAVLSHELDSPLATSKDAVTTLLDYRQYLLDAHTAHFLDVIEAQTNRLNDLLDDFVFAPGIQVRTLNLQSKPIVLRAVIG